MDTGTNLNKNNDIILQGVTKDDLVSEIAESVVRKMGNIVPDQKPSLQPLMSRKEAAEYLNISERSLDDLTKNGKIKYLKINSVVRFRLSDLDAFISKNEVKIKKF